MNTGVFKLTAGWKGLGLTIGVEGLLKILGSCTGDDVTLVLLPCLTLDTAVLVGEGTGGFGANGSNPNRSPF